jgi:hypothetical protein
MLRSAQAAIQKVDADFPQAGVGAADLEFASTQTPSAQFDRIHNA